MRFFVGLHQPSDARHFQECFISVNRLRDRSSDFEVRDWIMDSGAFTEISTHGEYRHPVEEYAEQVNRWKNCGNLLAAVSQDYMCEPFILEITGKTVREHQELTVERYLRLRDATDCNIMPVLQGYKASDYRDHLKMYGDILQDYAWVGVGSICKRNSRVGAIDKILWHIKHDRPDLRLHGFGLKTTALKSEVVRSLLYSADSMAWSFAARKQGRNSNDWREAVVFMNSIIDMPIQKSLLKLDPSFPGSKATRK